MPEVGCVNSFDFGCAPRSSCGFQRLYVAHALSQESLYLVRNFSSVCFQREMTGVIEMNLRFRLIPLERLSASRQEKRIVLPPDGEQRWKLRAEVRLKLRIER